MATFYTDLANIQQQGNNFPGAPGQPQIVNPPFWQNNEIFEAPPMIIATYVWLGTEVANDIINIGILHAGALVDPTTSRVTNGLTAPAVSLTIAVGDNDLGLLSQLPIPNAAGAAGNVGQVDSLQAPTWVTGTQYQPGNVVLDATTAPVSQGFTALIATNGATAPRSAANTTWMPNWQRYSNSIAINGAAANVAFAGGTQFYGTPPSVVPYSITPGALVQGYVGATTGLFQQYVIQNDCWAQARILTTNTIAANTVSVFRLSVITSA